MWIRHKGFISTIFLYYLMVIATIITIETTMIIMQLHTLENLKMTASTIIASHDLMARLRCDIWNHQEEGELSLDGVTITYSNDFDHENGQATICANGCTSFEYEYDFESNDGFQITLKH